MAGEESRKAALTYAELAVPAADNVDVGYVLAAVVRALLYVGDQVGEVARELDVVAGELPNAGKGF